MFPVALGPRRGAELPPRGLAGPQRDLTGGGPQAVTVTVWFLRPCARGPVCHPSSRPGEGSPGFPKQGPRTSSQRQKQKPH